MYPSEVWTAPPPLKYPLDKPSGQPPRLPPLNSCMGILIFTEGEFRLTGGPSANEGRLEVYHEGQWGTVCKHHFNNHAARVVCSEMGYNGPAAIDLDTLYASG